MIGAKAGMGTRPLTISISEPPGVPARQVSRQPPRQVSGVEEVHATPNVGRFLVLAAEQSFLIEE